MTNKDKTATNTTETSTKRRFDIGPYFTRFTLIIIGLVLLVCMFLVLGLAGFVNKKTVVEKSTSSNTYWFVLHRKSNTEYLYKGVPGDKAKSALVREFKVKGGVPGEKPTPLPQLLGKKYWVITKKFETFDNPETAPYFIELNVPAPDSIPYGPTPYLECGGQCNWEIPGPFGLHGVNGDISRLEPTSDGSSGCIRHNDEDIAYLYSLIDPISKIRYYIEDV